MNCGVPTALPMIVAALPLADGRERSTGSSIFCAEFEATVDGFCQAPINDECLAIHAQA